VAFAACRSTSSGSGLREEASAVGGAVAATPEVSPAPSGGIRCRFEVPMTDSVVFEVTASPGGGALTNVSATYSSASAAGSPKTKASAQLAPREKLSERWDKPIRNQKANDRSLVAYEKHLFKIDHRNYDCFDISGVGPKREDYLCLPKGAATQGLWVSDFRYEKDLNVIATNCQ
jgi:hypothetical protein